VTRLAIDLGTSHTVAVVERPGQQPRPLLFDGSPVLPSGVFAAADGGIHVGRDAVRLAHLEPHRYEPHPKRRVDEGTVLLGDAEFPVAMLLGALLHRVTQEAGHATTTVITCPADWGRLRRQVLVDAAHRAGIADPVLVDEPVAAAAYCTRVLGGHALAGQSLLVFDFGGGTLDLAVVRLDPTGTRVTGVSGLENLGGLDIDEALVGHLGQLVAARDPAGWHRLSRPSNPAELRDRRAFRDEVRVAKEMLSRTTVAPVSVPGWSETLHLTREELDRLAGPLVDRAVDETRRLLDGVGVAPSGILLVGGSSRIPLVATRLHGRFGVAPMVPEQPELPVALGALASLAEVPVAPPAPTSGAPTAPVSGSPQTGSQRSANGGAAFLPGDNTSTGIPISGPPGDAGAPWTGRPQGPQWTAPPPPPRRAPRGALILAIAASVTLVVLAGATIWFVRDAVRGKDTPSKENPAAASTPSSAPNRGPAPTGFAW
jgi:molecular chaperone DnaK (HSP70)